MALFSISELTRLFSNASESVKAAFRTAAGIGLPLFPSAGSRDGKVAKFDGDVLRWIVEATAGGAAILRGNTAPASELGKTGDLYIRDNVRFYIKSNSTTWEFVNHFLDHTIIRYLRQRWEKTGSGETIINGNDAATIGFSFEESDNLLGANFRPSLLENKSELSIRFDTRISRSAADDGTLNLKIYNGDSVIQGQISVGHDPIIYDEDISIESTFHNISEYFRLKVMAKSKLDFVFTTTGFQGSTNITIPSFTVYVGEAEINEIPDLPLHGSRDGKIAKFDGDVLKWEPDGTLPVFAEIPIPASLGLGSRTTVNPIQLSLGSPTNVLNNTGIAERSGTNLIQLAAGAYLIRVSLMVANQDLGSDGRTSFMAALYDSGGNELQKIEPLSGYSRNLRTGITAYNHTGEFLLNMTAAGSISLRAKLHQIDVTQNSINPQPQTVAGGNVKVIKL